MSYLDRFRLDGRRAFVTGGGQGIGLACAQALQDAGALVTVADRDPDLLGAALETLGTADGIILDVTDSAAVSAAADRLGAIDILVNNAGIARSDTPAEEVADEHWLNVLDVNLAPALVVGVSQLLGGVGHLAPALAIVGGVTGGLAVLAFAQAIRRAPPSIVKVD